MELNGVEIDDTYCEAFGTVFTRVLITAENEKWAKIAGDVVTGYGTSTIHCDAEAGIDSILKSEETPDNRPGVTVMFFKNKKD
ncbi:MAG: formylmethanofuran--tetrahydromethanopterin N-formyltransferase, partial [Promethearchaeota archaeon]